METPQTIQTNLAKQLGLEVNLYLKREDLHPYGSHKGRSIPVMIDNHQQAGWHDFVISSSGNAALAAIYAVRKYNKNNPKNLINLKILLGKNIDSKKFKEIKKIIRDDQNITVEQMANPKQRAWQLDKQGRAKFLRQSTDDLALIGYYDLAKELSAIKNLSAIFIPTSSGATAQGLFAGCQKLKINPQIHIVQTANCHPLVTNKRPAPSDKNDKSIAGAIVDKVAHRKTAVLQAIKNSRGAGWIANNEEIKQTVKLVKKTANLNISPNGALAIVGLRQAIKQGLKFTGPVVCLITGR